MSFPAISQAGDQEAEQRELLKQRLGCLSKTMVKILHGFG